MLDRGSGGVVNVASTIAFQPGAYQAVYGATKAFVLSFSEAVRVETRGTGVRVLTLCPGPVDTGFLAGLGDDRAPAPPSTPGSTAPTTSSLSDCTRSTAIGVPSSPASATLFSQTLPGSPRAR
ncbi:SDR family NAD(P)-dependent oxidoreductase [Streptomyces sp. NPDC002402]